MSQKKKTDVPERYQPETEPVVKISPRFQLSGIGDGLTRSFEMVIMVPGKTTRFIPDKDTQPMTTASDQLGEKMDIARSS